MKFKVGDKARVKKDLEGDKTYGVDSFVYGMEKYRGKIVTIIGVWNDGEYRIKEDNGDWFWTDEMLEPIEGKELELEKAGEPDGESNEKAANDTVAHPSHYTQGKIEVIDFIQDKGLSFAKGNVVKYVVRAGHKPEGDARKELEDLRKAKQYIDFAIRECERGYYQTR